MRTLFKKSMWLAGVAIMAAFVAAPARAETIALDFRGGLGGILRWNGGTCPLIGENIVIDTIEGQNTPENAGIFSISNGLLNFTTGPGSFMGTDDNGVASFNFSSGGSVTLTGGLSDAPDDGVPDGSMLISGGTWRAGANSLRVVPECDENGEDCTYGGSFMGAGTGGITLDGLLDFFGMTAWIGLPFSFINTEIFLDLVWNDPADFSRGFVASIRSTDFTSQAPPIPEPASIIMLGTGMIGLARMLRRKSARA